MIIFERLFCREEYFRDTGCCIPSWARGEHLDRILPLKELWRY